ncbi:MAG: protein phosphatase 2C domain-containing protein, partial [Chthonomonadales bacterium]
MHLERGRPRDDAFACLYADGRLAAAVADGLGSRPHSRYGAAFAVAALCEELVAAMKEGPIGEPEAVRDFPQVAAGTTSNGPLLNLRHRLRRSWPWPLREMQPRSPVPVPVPDFGERAAGIPRDEAAEYWGTLAWRRSAPQEASAHAAALERAVRRAFQRARARLERYAADSGVPLEDLGCTLMGVLVDTSEGSIAAGHVGDGLTSWLHPRHGAQALVEPPSTNDPGQTFTFTQPDWEARLAVAAYASEEAADAPAIFLMTDGVAQDCTHPPPEGIFEKWSRDVEREMRSGGDAAISAQRLVRWLATYEARGSWDDRTLVVLLRDMPDTAIGVE